MIPEDFIQELLGRVDIVDVVGQYVPLKKGGVNLLGLCPFHKESTPSFTVSPSKQFYHCFGCGVHGSAITFLMEHTGATFPEAVKTLAARVGMQVPEKQYSPAQQAAAKERKTHHEQLTEVLVRANEYYYSQLKSTEIAQQYFIDRGIDGKTAKRFSLGWAAPKRQNLAAVFPEYQDDLLVDSGLVIESEDGRRYDRFRDRVMFPIFNNRGSIIGFGGRIIGQGQPKYLNSPETDIFHKGRELYGIWQNRQAIHRASCVIVVEGYMDVVSLACHGVDYAVATLGTATSEDHIKQLIKISEKIIFSFDGDQAGKNAALKAMKTCLPLLRDDVMMRFLFLPDKQDPDSFILANGKEAFEEQLEQAKPLSSFLLSTLSSSFNLEEAEGRAAGIYAFYEYWQMMPDIALSKQIFNEFAKMVKSTPEELLASLRQRAQSQQAKESAWKTAPAQPRDEGVPSQPAATTTSSASATRKSNYSKATYSTKSRTTPLSRRLIALLLLHPELFDSIKQEQIEVLSDHPNLSVVVNFIAFVLAQKSRYLSVWLEQLDSKSDLYQILVALQRETSDVEPLPAPQKEWHDAVLKVELENLLTEQKDLVSAGLTSDADRRRYQVLNARIAQLRRQS